MKYFYNNLVLALGLSFNICFADSLEDIYFLALKNDPQLAAESASRQATSELTSQAKARFLPEVSLSADNGRLWQDGSNNNQEYNTHGYSLSLTQPIYRKQNFILKSQAETALNSAEAHYQVVEQDLIIRTAERYFEVLSSQDILLFDIAQREAISKQLEQSEQRLTVGLATVTDVSESKAAYDLSNATVINSKNNLTNSKERLREITGIYPEVLSTLQADIPLVSPEPEDIEQWTSMALIQNPRLLVVKSAVNNADQNIQLQKSGHYPTLDIVGQKSYSSQGDSSLGGGIKTHQDSIGLQVNLPLYSGGRVLSRTREAGYRLNEAMFQEEQEQRSITRETREAYNSVLSNIGRVNALKQAVLSNEQALESTIAGYDVGLRTTVDILNVRQELFSAKSDYARSRYDYILSTLRLKQASGTVTVTDIKLINQWLEE